MAKKTAGRLPYVSDSHRRLDPATICTINEGYLFQDNVAQLLEGLLHGFPATHVTWGGLPPASPNGGTAIETDWVTWKSPTYDYNGKPGAAFIDFESSVRYLEDNSEYVAEKVLSLVRLIGTPGGIVQRVHDLRSAPERQALPELPEQPDVFLIFVANHSQALPDSIELQSLLRGKKGKLGGTDPTISCSKAGPNGEAREIKLQSGRSIFVGIVNKEKLIELSYEATALNHAKQNDLVDERFFHELTLLAGRPLLLDQMPRKLSIQSASTPTSIVVEGKHVVYYRFSVDPLELLRLTSVMRLVSDYDYLQRLPEGPHLEDMASDVGAGGRFPTPILVIPSEFNKPTKDLAHIIHSGGAILSPYQWNIIDGQHRVYCYYLVKPGIGLQSLDVNCYEPSAAADRAAIASALFLNVNFKALKPPIDLALAHGAYASRWAGGSWVPRKRGRQTGGDSKLYSSRLLASRFLLELSGSPSAFRDFFKHVGTVEAGKVSIQSISTYLGVDFNLKDPADPTNLIACRFGTVPGASGIWTNPDPPPDSLQKLWDELVSEFDDFLRAIVEGPGRTFVSGRDQLQRLVKENNNVFVGLWKVYYWYSMERNRGVVTPPKFPKRLAARILPWLTKLSQSKRLSGPRNAYRSGSGAVRISNRLIKLCGGP